MTRPSSECGRMGAKSEGGTRKTRPLFVPCGLPLHASSHQAVPMGSESHDRPESPLSCGRRATIGKLIARYGTCQDLRPLYDNTDYAGAEGAGVCPASCAGTEPWTRAFPAVSAARVHRPRAHCCVRARGCSVSPHTPCFTSWHWLALLWASSVCTPSFRMAWRNARRKSACDLRWVRGPAMSSA